MRISALCGANKTVILPPRSPEGNQAALELTRRVPKQYVRFANADPIELGAVKELEKHLKAGALGIGEQKSPLDCDSAAMQAIFQVAQEFGVPVLVHFQHQAFNMGIERFHKMLEKYPKVKFIGHAQTWWGNIDRKHEQKVMYPKGPVTRGGITDQLLADYPNVYGDLSAGSGLNAVLRDEDHAREFLARHQDKLIFGTDCNDRVGQGDACSGARCIAALRRLSPAPAALRKIFSENAVRVLKIPL